MTLTEYLTDMAEAVRRLTGKTDKMKPSDMPEQINSVYNAERLLDKSITKIKTNVSVIPDYAFYKQTNLVSVEIPNATKIGASAFQSCESLPSITIPDTVTSIDSSAFYDCESLTDVTIPNSVTSIGDWAFRSCGLLSNVNLPKRITEIPAACFMGDRKLLSINIPDSVTTLGYMCFDESGVKKADCKNVTMIGQQAFRQDKYNENLGLNTLILRADTVCTLSSTDALMNTPISRGIGYIYVPDDLIDSYKTATNWAVYANQIKGISEFESEVTE